VQTVASLVHQRTGSTATYPAVPHLLTANGTVDPMAAAPVNTCQQNKSICNYHSKTMQWDPESDPLIVSGI